MFLLIGFLLLGIGAFSWRFAARKKAVAGKLPDAPWLCKKAWASGRIPDKSNEGLLAAFVFAVGFNALGWPAIFIMYNDGAFAKNAATFLFFLFPLVGLVAGVVLVYLFLRRLKYGRSVFQMASVPGVVGGTLAGTVLTRTPIRGSQKISVYLRNTITTVSGSGKHRHSQTQTCWQTSARTIEYGSAGRGLTAVAVSFVIGPDCNETGPMGFGKTSDWEVVVSMETPGIDYKAVFEVPVFCARVSGR